MNIGSRITDDELRRIDSVRRFSLAWQRVPVGQGSGEWARLQKALGEDRRTDTSAIRAMVAIHEEGRCRMTDLADRLGLNASTATRAVDRLVADGLVDRVPDERDRRCVRVALTASGRDAVAEAADRTERLLGAVLEAFTLAEITGMAATLEQFGAALGEWSDFHAESDSIDADDG